LRAKEASNAIKKSTKYQTKCALHPNREYQAGQAAELPADRRNAFLSLQSLIDYALWLHTLHQSYLLQYSTVRMDMAKSLATYRYALGPDRNLPKLTVQLQFHSTVPTSSCLEFHAALDNTQLHEVSLSASPTHYARMCLHTDKSMYANLCYYYYCTTGLYVSIPQRTC
jgi:hypothetical protein